MPEQSISRGKYNFNKHQKDKQNKIMQYYRRSFKSQLAPAREITRPRRTRKLHIQPNPSSMSKLTKTQTPDTLESEQSKGKELDKKEKINLEKSTTTPIQKGGENQYVIMD